MALLAGAMCGVRNDSCSRKHKYARTSDRMASESLSRGVDLFLAQEFCFFKQEHGPPRGSKQVKTDVLLTTVLGPLRCLFHLPQRCLGASIFSRATPAGAAALSGVEENKQPHAAGGGRCLCAHSRRPATRPCKSGPYRSRRPVSDLPTQVKALDDFRLSQLCCCALCLSPLPARPSSCLLGLISCAIDTSPSRGKEVRGCPGRPLCISGDDGGLVNQS